MEVIVYPSAQPLRGKVVLPGDKSISHRLAVFGAVAQGESRFEHFLLAGVTEVMLEALRALGVAWHLEDGALIMRSPGLAGLQPPQHVLDCGHSASTLRFLTGLLALAGLPATLDGSAGLRRRPMARIVRPLRAMGVPLEAAEGHAPLRLARRGAPLRGLTWRMEVASAQVKTCLLLAGLAAEDRLVLTEPMPSRDHTERLMRALGLDLSAQKVASGWQIRFNPPPRVDWPGLHLRVPGDLSSAAFVLAAAALVPGSDVHLLGVGLNPGRTGLLDVLRAMGADVQITRRETRLGEPVGDVRLRYAPLHGVRVEGDLVVRMIDEFPVLAALAAFAEGETVVRGAQELRHKESDRIAALVALLRALGGEAEERPDGFVVRGGGLRGGVVQAPADHRLAMSAMLAGLAAEKPVKVREAEIYRQSFPAFLEVLSSLGASIISD